MLLRLHVCYNETTKLKQVQKSSSGNTFKWFKLNCLLIIYDKVNL